MRKWVVEDWKFELTAIEGKAGNCRLGIEKGDAFSAVRICKKTDKRTMPKDMR